MSPEELNDYLLLLHSSGGAHSIANILQCLYVLGNFSFFFFFLSFFFLFLVVLGFELKASLLQEQVSTT
jgi:hypothetical protein